MSTQSHTVLRTVVSNHTPAKYYIGEEEEIRVGGYSLDLNSFSLNVLEDDNASTYTGEIGQVEISTMGHLNPTRIASGLIQINEKIPSLNRPAFRTNSHRTLIRNFTLKNLYSVDRNGVKTLEKPQSMPVDYMTRSHLNCVVLREEYYYETAKAARASFEIMKNSPITKGLVAKKLTKLLEEAQDRCSLGCCVVVDYVIPEHKLLDLGTIYHTNTDRVISFTNDPESLEHPCSPDYVTAPLCNGPAGEKDVFSTFRYVSNNPNAQTLFVRVAGQLLHLKPCRASREIAFSTVVDGVETVNYHSEYVLINLQQAPAETAKLATPGTPAPAKITYRPYVIPVGDGMEKFGIYKNEASASKEFSDNFLQERKYDESIHLLEMKLSRAKLECDDIKRDARDSSRRDNERIDELKADIRKQAILNKEELDRKDILIEELKKSNHKETEELKEKREQSTHKAKTFHDYVKIFFGIVAGVLAIIPIYLKFRAANPVPLPI